MSIQDQEIFLSNIHPFESLTPSQMSDCIEHMDIAYYPKDTILISSEIIPEHFFIVIKGSVYEYSDDDNVVRDYQNEDCFDSNSIIYSKCENTFKVNEELICYQIDKKTFLNLMENNQEFKNFFLNDLVNKIQSLKEKGYASELSSFMMAKVEDTLIQEPCIVDENTKLIDAIDKSMTYSTSTIIVNSKKNSYGIITDSLLKVKVLLKKESLDILVKDIAIFPLITMNKSDYLFDALTIMIKKNIKRIGVVDSKGLMVGILEQIDVLSHFANHTYVIEAKINNAQSIEDLKNASNEFVNIIKNLQTKGVKINHISNLIGQLNVKIYKKIYSLILPQELQNNACLIVTGSEGRNEQIIKTDQNNALIIKDGFNKDKYRQYAKIITSTLMELGYPVCNSNIMASNEYWCKNKGEYKNEIKKCIDLTDTKSYLNLSVFIDAFAVAGDKNLLIELKDFLYEKVSNKKIFQSFFAKSTLDFETPTAFSSFIGKDNTIDIKKAAIFPLVHGIRSLCLREKIKETTTDKRIKILEAKNVLNKKNSAELREAFEIVNTIRLKLQLECIQSGSPLTNQIKINSLSKIERDLLKEALKIIVEFKKHINLIFKIDKIQ